MTDAKMQSQVSRRTFLRTSALAAGATPLVGLALAACGSSGGSSSATKSAASLSPFNFNLGFVPNGRNAPFYYGKKQGIFAKHGVDLTIGTSSGTGAVLQLLSAGRTASAIVGASAMMKLMAQTPKPAMESFATLYVKSTSTIFFIKGKGISKPKDLEGKTIATSAGSNEQLLFPVFAAANGIDASKVKWKVVDPSVKTGLILTNTTDASSTTIFGLAQLQNQAKDGQEIGYFTYGDWGVHGDVTCLASTTDYNSSHGDTLKGFIQGAMESVKAALASPADAVAAMKADVSTLDTAVAKAEMDILKNLVAGPEQKKHGLGWNDSTAYEATVQLVDKYLQATVPGSASDYYSNDYIGSVKP